MKKSSNAGIAGLFFILAAVLASLVPAELNAKKEFYEAARKKYGKQVKGCKHCHMKLLPDEEQHELNPRGRWLLEQKTKRQAETVDIRWLDDYVESEDKPR